MSKFKPDEPVPIRVAETLYDRLHYAAVMLHQCGMMTDGERTLVAERLQTWLGDPNAWKSPAEPKEGQS